MGIIAVKDKAERFYSVMYFYYSVYDGTDDKEMVKEEFVPELDFVMYRDKELIGQNIFVRTAIAADDYGTNLYQE